jgi:hypothetical protein
VDLTLFLESCKSVETRRVYSIYLNKYAENYDLNETNPKTIEENMN